MTFVSARIMGPYAGDHGPIYAVSALWDSGGNFRCAYSESDYPQMQIDFAAWADSNGDYPDASAYAAAANWNI